MLINELFGFKKKSKSNLPEPESGFDRDSWLLGWKACRKDATVDAEVQYKRNHSEADRKSFIAGFNACMKDLGLSVSVYGNANGITSNSLHYGELKRSGVV